MTKDEIMNEIQTLRNIVAMAQDKLKEDQFLDMDMIQSKVDSTCEQVAELSPEDASEVRDPLSGLLNDLKAYADYVVEFDRNGNDGNAASGQ